MKRKAWDYKIKNTNSLLSVNSLVKTLSYEAFTCNNITN